MSNWNPVAEPYRVLAIYHSSERLHYGWKSGRPETFATLEEAQKRFNENHGRGVKSVSIHFAENASTWMKNGRWKLIQTRKSRSVAA